MTRKTSPMVQWLGRTKLIPVHLLAKTLQYIVTKKPRCRKTLQHHFVNSTSTYCMKDTSKSGLRE